MSYTQLHDHFKRIGDVDHALAMLSWDEAAMMPDGGGEVRAESIATLEGLRHQWATEDRVGDLVEDARQDELDSWQSANVDLIEREWRLARALPPDLVMAMSRATSACEQAWRPARGANDWNAVKVKLDTVMRLTREKAQALGDALGCEPHDALIDSYQPGMTRAQIDPLFSQLAEALPPMIDQAIGAQAAPLAIDMAIASDRQEALGRALMGRIGFDFNHGRLGESHHPFCGGVPDDTRITTRYNERDFLECMFAVLHENGHALYQQGLPQAWRGQPVGGAGGMALHESQSLLMEMQVCRGDAFLHFAAPIIQESLLGSTTDDAAWQPDNLVKLAASVRKGFIRVDSDELTYPLHVILRHELEAGLIDGSLATADIPDAWHDKMTRYLGLSTAGNFKDGCMQDVHWFAGLVGYFPSYTLGAVMAAQIFATAKQRLPNLDDAIRRGEFETLVDWLRANIHGRGQSVTALALIAEVTGEPLNAEAFLNHLQSRYLA